MSPLPAVPARRRTRRILLSTLLAGACVTAAAVVTAPAATAAARPAVPTGLHASAGAAGTYLTWHRGSVSSYSIEVATNSSFRGGHSYLVRWNAGSFTPTSLARGRTYWFRIGAHRGSSWSGWSRAVSARPTVSLQGVRVMTYNSLSNAFANHREGSGRIAPWGKRMPGQVSLLRQYGADAIAVQEASHCLIHYRTKPCWRQVDSLKLHLGSAYGLANTDRGPKGRYADDYILYRKATVQPVWTGGNWSTGDGTYSSYQVLQVKRTGARFLFVSVHLTAPRGAKNDAKRGRETKSLLGQAQAYARQAHVSSIVYGGDYNTYLGEWRTYNYSGTVLLGARMSDGITVARSRYYAQYNSFNGYFRKAPTGGHSLDHIYATSGVALLSWGEIVRLNHGKFVGTIPSDHNPVYSYIQVPY